MPDLIETETEYDLYLARGCNALPAFDELEERVPIVINPAFQQLPLTRQAADLGFLQLHLPQPVAEQLLRHLQTTGAIGAIVLAAYRHPKITREEAQKLAEHEIERLRTQHYPSYQFSPAVLYAERPQTWTYTAPCEQLIQEGYIPGALFADVDKLDGHIWTEEEVEAEG